jgi:restriction system protein
MAIPDYQTLMLPLLKFGEDQQEHSLRQAVESLSAEFQLSEDERKALLNSGQQTVIANRVGWAGTYLKKAGLFESTRRGFFRITPRGLDVLQEKPSRIDQKYLNRFPEFAEFKNARGVKEDAESEAAPTALVFSERTPEEEIEDAFQRIRISLAAELLTTVRACSPERFERLVVDLLVRMGYGGTRKDAGQAIGRSGDGGIDGIIKEDRLGLDAIYIQAKRWADTNSVGRPEIQKFAGALQGHRARKGVFITTSYFTKDATDYVDRIDSKIVLIDGVTLAQLMIDFGLGVAPIAAYEVKRIDSDYFTDEE